MNTILVSKCLCSVSVTLIASLVTRIVTFLSLTLKKCKFLSHAGHLQTSYIDSEFKNEIELIEEKD